jgi:hypothetical protein
VARFAPPLGEPRLSLLPPSLTLNKELGRRSFLRVKDSTSGPLRGGVFLSRSGEIKKRGTGYGYGYGIMAARDPVSSPMPIQLPFRGGF